MLATDRAAAGELVGLFRRRQVHKYYVALSDRRPAKKMGSVVGDLEASGPGGMEGKGVGWGMRWDWGPFAERWQRKMRVHYFTR